MSKKENRKQVIKISVFITSIFVFFMSITYAFINLTLTGTKKQIIRAGELSLELKEQNAITITDALPMYDEVGLLQPSFNFQLVNNGKNKVDYAIKLIDITEGERLSPNIIRYGLTKNSITRKKYLKDIQERVIDSGTIEGQKTNEYELRLWIDSEVTKNEQISGKSLKFRIDVEAGQLNEAKEVGMIKKASHIYDTTGGETEFWQDDYRNKIETIVLEKEISIPEETAIESWDVSQKQDKSVMAYIENSGEDKYKLHIQVQGKIKANPDSSHLFYDFSNLTSIEGLENLDTSAVKNMDLMFYNSVKLTEIDLSTFDTSQVTTMRYAFAGDGKTASKMLLSNIIGIENLDVSRVENMHSLFQLGSYETLNLNQWNTENVTDMGYLFAGCSNLKTLEISNWDTSKVTTMIGLIHECKGLTSLDIKNWNLSQTLDISGMFANCSGLSDLDLSNWNISNDINMDNIFHGCTVLSRLDLSNMTFDGITKYNGMFTSVPSSCTIIVKDDKAKTWLETNPKPSAKIEIKQIS